MDESSSRRLRATEAANAFNQYKRYERQQTRENTFKRSTYGYRHYIRATKGPANTHRHHSPSDRSPRAQCVTQQHLHHLPRSQPLTTQQQGYNHRHAATTLLQCLAAKQETDEKNVRVRRKQCNTIDTVPPDISKLSGQRTVTKNA